MNYLEFQKKYQDVPILYSRDLVKRVRNPQAMRNQLRRWRGKGLLLKLRKGAYVLSGPACRRPDIHWIANCLYGPSYLSLEYALSFYGLIPERAADIVSVTTLKTMRFQNDLGSFVYRHVQPEAFQGFRSAGSGAAHFFMAEPEKAVVDFLYFHLAAFGGDAGEVGKVLKESYRFQNIESLNEKKLVRWAGLFGNSKLKRVVSGVCRLIREESK